MESPLVTAGLVLLLLATMLTVGTSLTVRAFRELLGRPHAASVAGLAAYRTPGLGSRAARRAIAMTTTIRNLSLALLVAGLSPDPAGVSLTVLAYGLVMYAASGLALIPLRRTAPARKEFA